MVVRDAYVGAHECVPKSFQKHQADFAFYCKIPPDADNSYAKFQPGVMFNGHIYKPLNTKISTGNTDIPQNLATLVSSALLLAAQCKSQLSACHHSRPQ